MNGHVHHNICTSGKFTQLLPHIFFNWYNLWLQYHLKKMEIPPCWTFFSMTCYPQLNFIKAGPTGSFLHHHTKQYIPTGSYINIIYYYYCYYYYYYYYALHPYMSYDWLLTFYGIASLPLYPLLFKFYLTWNINTMSQHSFSSTVEVFFYRHIYSRAFLF